MLILKPLFLIGFFNRANFRRLGLSRPYRWRPYPDHGKSHNLLAGRIRATAIGYGLIATGIALGFLPVLTVLGGQLKSTFLGLSTALK